MLGYTPAEFRAALHLLADGKVDPSPLVTGTVGLDGVAGAFDALADPEAHAKVLVDPRDLRAVCAPHFTQVGEFLDRRVEHSA